MYGAALKPNLRTGIQERVFVSRSLILGGSNGLFLGNGTCNTNTKITFMKVHILDGQENNPRGCIVSYMGISYMCEPDLKNGYLGFFANEPPEDFESGCDSSRAIKKTICLSP